MLKMRPDCERCGRDLPADWDGALICLMECTFCDDCAHGALAGVCPNCGGELQPRPTRVAAMLDNYPGSTERRYSATR